MRSRRVRVICSKCTWVARRFSKVQSAAEHDAADGHGLRVAELVWRTEGLGIAIGEVTAFFLTGLSMELSLLGSSAGCWMGPAQMERGFMYLA